MTEQKYPGTAIEVFTQIMGIYRYDATALEARLWLQLIEDFGDAAVIAFLIRHVESSVFAPKPSEARTALCPAHNNAMAAFEELARAVSKFGPYVSPKFEDPAIAGAVILMGGWIKVNETMPDPSSRFDFEAYFKRFDVVYKQSHSNILKGDGYTKPLRGIHFVDNEAAEKLRLQLTHNKVSDT